MRQLKTATRLALSLGLVAAAAVWVALSVGVLENPAVARAERRVSIARYISVYANTLINAKRETQLKMSLQKFVDSEPSLVSIGVRTTRGRLISGGPHEDVWNSESTPSTQSSLSDFANHVYDSNPNPNQVTAELLSQGRAYGSIEFAFQPEPNRVWSMFFGFPVPLASFVGAVVSLLGWIIFARSFKYLDPSQVVPDRVRSALDTMAEGVVLLDKTNEVGHANEAFGHLVDRDPGLLLGTKIDDFNWTQSSDFGGTELPWSQCLKEQHSVCGVVVNLTLPDSPTRKFMVNASPIVSTKNECRGVLASFEDVTAMENKKHELSQMISTLRQSRDEVERKNVQLNFLASYDQLTECLNRREFFKRYEEVWADDSVKELSVVMLDIDHFKSVNDNHGHGKGDTVLKEVARILRDCVGDRGTVARMGGEEFVAILPNLPLGPGTLVAEEVRQAICQDKIGDLEITVSIGVSSRELGPMDTQHLLDQADQALYTAKENGRNRVVRYNERDEVVAESANQSLNPVPLDSTQDLSDAILEQLDELANLSDQAPSKNDDPIHVSKMRKPGR